MFLPVLLVGCRSPAGSKGLLQTIGDMMEWVVFVLLGLMGLGLALLVLGTLAALLKNLIQPSVWSRRVGLFCGALNIAFALLILFGAVINPPREPVESQVVVDVIEVVDQQGRPLPPEEVTHTTVTDGGIEWPALLGILGIGLTFALLGAGSGLVAWRAAPPPAPQ